MPRFLAIAALLLAAGCDADPPLERCHADDEPPAVAAAGDSRRFVVDSVELPASATRSLELGIDLDGDEQSRPDNGLGNVLSAVFGALDTPIDAKLADEIAAGNILHLIEVVTPSIDDGLEASAQVFLGIDRDGDPADNFSGEERFDVDTGPATQPLIGRVVDGHLSAELGTISLRISFPEVDDPFVLELSDARIEADVDDDALRGRIGGAISEHEIADVLVPAVYQTMVNSVAADCPGGRCEPGSNGETFLTFFDHDSDGMIELREVRESSTVMSLLAPDMDLHGCDYTKESLSVGVGFTAVPARFAAP